MTGFPDEEYGEGIAAFLVPKPGEETSREEIIQYCKKNLAVYKRPKIVEFMPSLPKASSGKVLKRELSKQYGKGNANRA